MSELTPNQLLTTFRTPVVAQQVVEAKWPRHFIRWYNCAKTQQVPFIVLGQGSNVLFTQDFAGIIVLNKFIGIKTIVNSDHYLVHVNSGVTIDELIDYCHRFKIYGLENLTSIPSSIGTAVIGNIGAYGVEFSKFVQSVEVLNLETQEIFHLNNQQCEFDYRDSIFKHKLKNHYVILSVTLCLKKEYHPVLTYAPLNSLDISNVCPKQLRALVDQTRATKLPDYNENGNAGSFFVNPIINKALFEELLIQYPNLVYYHAPQEHVKLSAGWLIENAGLKGFKLENAQVSPKHALVLTNANQQSTGEQIARLAAYVQHQVFAKFKVNLVPEVRFIGKNGEIDALEYIKN